MIICTKPSAKFLAAVTKCSALLTQVAKSLFESPTEDEMKSLLSKSAAIVPDPLLKCIAAGSRYLKMEHNCKLSTKQLDIAQFARLGKALDF